MGDLDVYRRSNADAPIDLLLRSEEWRPLVRFAEGWFRQPISEATGIASSELDELERRFGTALPAALREWYRMFGAHESTLFDTNQDFVMPLERVGQLPRWLVLYGENQEGWHCGILREDCHLPDPPVSFESFSFDLVKDAGYQPEELVDGRFLRITTGLSEFILGMTLKQLATGQDPSEVMVSGVSSAEFTGEGGADLIRSRFEMRQIFDFPAGFSPEYDGSGLFMVPELRIIARTPEVFEEAWRVVKSSGIPLSPEWRAE